MRKHALKGIARILIHGQDLHAMQRHPSGKMGEIGISGVPQIVEHGKPGCEQGRPFAGLDEVPRRLLGVVQLGRAHLLAVAVVPLDPFDLAPQFVYALLLDAGLLGLILIERVQSSGLALADLLEQFWFLFFLLIQFRLGAGHVLGRDRKLVQRGHDVARRLVGHAPAQGV